MNYCSVKGCGRRVAAKGLCEKHYRRNKKHGSPFSLKKKTPKQKSITTSGNIAYIELTKGKYAKIDISDVDIIKKYSWQYSSSGYAVHKGETSILMHRYIIGSKNEQEVDHINQDKLDNRRENLRICTHSENLSNRKKFNGSLTKYKGIYRRGDKFCAKIQKNNKVTHLGTFNTEEEAAKAYNIASESIYGKFSSPNKL
jgi:hypothetical protein